MSRRVKVQTTLHESLQRVFDAKGKSPLSSLHQKAWAAFESRGFPGLKEESFQYVKWGALFSQTFKRSPIVPIEESLLKEALAPYENQNVLVFYNGSFVLESSCFQDVEDELVILPLREAYSTYSTFIDQFFESEIEKERDPFALLSLALFSEGLFIYVPKNTSVEKELFILEIQDGSSSISTPMTLISLGAQASLKLSRSRYSSHGSEGLNLSYEGFHLNHEAKLIQAEAILGSKQIELCSKRVHQAKLSQFKDIQVALGGDQMRSSYRVELLGEGAESDILSLSALKGGEQSHTHILMEHRAPHCTSRQLVKNLLNEESSSSFEGKIRVESWAQKTNAYQLNANCILSDQASAYSKPNLEIFADDVKASHGSTTGQVDPEQLFYLRSRGLSQEKANQILLSGFCEEILQEISSLIIKEQVELNFEPYFDLS